MKQETISLDQRLDELAGLPKQLISFLSDGLVILNTINLINEQDSGGGPKYDELVQLMKMTQTCGLASLGQDSQMYQIVTLVIKKVIENKYYTLEEIDKTYLVSNAIKSFNKHIEIQKKKI